MQSGSASHSFIQPSFLLDSLQSSMVSGASFAPAQPMPQANAAATLFRDIDAFLAQTRRVSMGASAAPPLQEMPPLTHQMPLPQMNSRPAPPQGLNKKRSNATSRKNLRMLVLVKILVRDLERTGDIALKHQVKAIVKECNRQRRNQVNGFPPLEEAVELLLKGTVGVARWAKAKQELDSMMTQRRLRLLASR